ncbi:hypothetical protein DERF_003689 [Dermatophagoides farinae]|uniref:C2H2-type domain-containing protein n=1 Tax=Dermatophagoides farinae TaxID=6954 RepID=A0A922IF64_DERFA|nr:hypothetical protein DERF_003689 [Dermatophagoides farinae]
MPKVFLTKENRRLIRIMLHYRHMFLYLMKHYADEIDDLFEKDSEKDNFKTTVEYCDKWFEKITSNAEDRINQLNKLIVELIEETESSYGSHRKLMKIDLDRQIISNSKKNGNGKDKKTNSKKQKKQTDKQSDPDTQQDNNIGIDNDDDGDTTFDIFGIAMQYTCSLGCRFRSTSMKKIKNHELLVHSGEKKVHKCLYKNCGGQFKTIYDLEKHSMKIHEIFKCSFGNCESEFDSEFYLKKHYRLKHEKESVICKECDRKFPNSTRLRKHIYLFHEYDDYHCDYDGCDFSTTLRLDLFNHKRTKHLHKKCEFDGCNSILSISGCSIHKKLHTKAKTYQCSWPDCGKCLYDSKSLKDHIRIHLNFKRYRCKWPDCGYACEQKTNMITHIRIRHFKLPHTKKRQLELNISTDSYPNPNEYIETVNEDIYMNNRGNH